MSSKEIIIKLIDEKLISGEEAYVLINDIIQGELTESWKILNSNPNSFSTHLSNILTTSDSTYYNQK